MKSISFDLSNSKAIPKSLFGCDWGIAHLVKVFQLFTSYVTQTLNSSCYPFSFGTTFMNTRFFLCILEKILVRRETAPYLSSKSDFMFLTASSVSTNEA